MKPHTDVPGLDGLDEIVHQQRRMVAARARVRDEDHKLTDAIAAKLQAAGVRSVTVTIPLGTFLVSLATSRANTTAIWMRFLSDPCFRGYLSVRGAAERGGPKPQGRGAGFLHLAGETGRPDFHIVCPG